MNSSRIIRIALIVSIAVNLVLIGGIGYRALDARNGAPRPFPPNIGWAVRDLDENRQRELQPLLSRGNNTTRPMREQMLQAMRRVNELMRADDFDGEALREAFAELRASSARYQELSHEQTITLLSEMTEEERRTAQEFMQRRGPRGVRRFNPGAEFPGGREPPQRPR